MNPRHLKGSPNWGTPAWLAAMCREVMTGDPCGQIDLDPCSTPEQNQVVNAAAYYTAEQDGLVCPWYGDMLINPPGGLVREFWNRLVTHRASIRQAIWIGFSLEHLRTCQSPALSLLDLALCVPKRRIAFVPPPGKTGASPTHANVIGYLAGTVDHAYRFRRVFAEIGVVR